MAVFVVTISPQGHLDAVLCLQFDDRRLISGSMDRSVRIWDVRSGRSIRKLYGHKVRRAETLSRDFGQPGASLRPSGGSWIFPWAVPHWIFWDRKETLMNFFSLQIFIHIQQLTGRVGVVFFTK